MKLILFKLFLASFIARVYTASLLKSAGGFMDRIIFPKNTRHDMGSEDKAVTKECVPKSQNCIRKFFNHFVKKSRHADVEVAIATLTASAEVQNVLHELDNEMREDEKNKIAWLIETAATDRQEVRNACRKKNKADCENEAHMVGERYKNYIQQVVDGAFMHDTQCFFKRTPPTVTNVFNFYEKQAEQLKRPFETFMSGEKYAAFLTYEEKHLPAHLTPVERCLVTVIESQKKLHEHVEYHERIWTENWKCVPKEFPKILRPQQNMWQIVILMDSRYTQLAQKWLKYEDHHYKDDFPEEESIWSGPIVAPILGELQEEMRVTVGDFASKLKKHPLGSDEWCRMYRERFGVLARRANVQLREENNRKSIAIIELPKLEPISEFDKNFLSGRKDETRLSNATIAISRAKMYDDKAAIYEKIRKHFEETHENFEKTLRNAVQVMKAYLDECLLVDCGRKTLFQHQRKARELIEEGKANMQAGLGDVKNVEAGIYDLVKIIQPLVNVVDIIDRGKDELANMQKTLDDWFFKYELFGLMF